jgi:hypothetical protein
MNARRVIIGAVVALAASCSHSPKPALLTLHANLDLCRATNCVFAPATTAQFRVFFGSHIVARGTADDSGTYSVKLPAGTYTADVTVPELGLHLPQANAGEITLIAGGSADSDLNFQPMTVTPLH